MTKIKYSPQVFFLLWEGRGFAAEEASAKGFSLSLCLAPISPRAKAPDGRHNGQFD